MAFDLALFASLFNYLAIAAIFVHAYFNPKGWNDWLVSAYVTYVLIYMLTAFLFILTVFLGWLPCAWPLLALYLAAIVWAAKISFEAAGSKTLVPFLLYIGSIALQIYSLFAAGNPVGGVIYLAVMYFAGVMVLYPLGMLISIPLGLIAPEGNREHKRLMIEKYGESVLRTGITLNAKSGGSVGVPYMPPSFMVGVAIAYCIWMLITIVIARQFGLWIA